MVDLRFVIFSLSLKCLESTRTISFASRFVIAHLPGMTANNGITQLVWFRADPCFVRRREPQGCLCIFRVCIIIVSKGIILVMSIIVVSKVAVKRSCIILVYNHGDYHSEVSVITRRCRRMSARSATWRHPLIACYHLNWLRWRNRPSRRITGDC
jgi:hypothetical protein